MTTKRRGGRRPLSGIRDGQFHVRCTEEERAAVEAMADRLGCERKACRYRGEGVRATGHRG